MPIETSRMAKDRILTITFKVSARALDGFKKRYGCDVIFLPALIEHFEQVLREAGSALESSAPKLPTKTFTLRRTKSTRS